MFKKLLLLTALTTGFGGFNISAMETTEIIQAVVAPANGGTLQWFKHFVVASLVYNVVGTAERKMMDVFFPIIIQPEDFTDVQTAEDLTEDWEKDLADIQTMVAIDGEEQRETPLPKINGKNIAIRAVAAFATLYGCYKLTNYLHQQMSPESYRWAHFLGAIF